MTTTTTARPVTAHEARLADKTFGPAYRAGFEGRDYPVPLRDGEGFRAAWAGAYEDGRARRAVNEAYKARVAAIGGERTLADLRTGDGGFFIRDDEDRAVAAAAIAEYEARRAEDAGYRDGYYNAVPERRLFPEGVNPDYDRGVELGKAGKDGRPEDRFSRREVCDDCGKPAPDCYRLEEARRERETEGYDGGFDFEGPDGFPPAPVVEPDVLTAVTIAREAVRDGRNPVDEVVAWQEGRERNAARIAAIEADKEADKLTAMERAIADNKKAWDGHIPDDDIVDDRAQKLAEDLNAAMARSAALEDEPRDVRAARRAREEAAERERYEADYQADNFLNIAAE